jgi:hypothetical protein
MGTASRPWQIDSWAAMVIVDFQNLLAFFRVGLKILTDFSKDPERAPIEQLSEC